MPERPPIPPHDGDSPRFRTTRWTVVGQAGSADGREEAWDHFCRSYWYPVYAFIRRKGETAENARDLTQGFFAKLIENDWLAGVKKRDSRFSTLLITVLKNYLINEHARASASKRGGGVPALSLDLANAEDWFGREPATSVTPETFFEKRWATAVLDAAMRRLQDEYAIIGKGKLHELLSPFLSNEPAAGDYDRAAEALGIQTKSVAVAVHRLRLDFRAMVREEVAVGLRDKNLVDEEMRALAAALGI